MDLSNNRINPKLEQDGVWNQIDLETSVLVARWMNPVHEAYIRKNGKPLQQAIRMNALSEEAQRNFEIDSMIDCILLDWKGMKANGEELPYSKEEARKVLENPELSWFKDMIEGFSRDLSMYKMEDNLILAEEIKKS